MDALFSRLMWLRAGVFAWIALLSGFASAQAAEPDFRDVFDRHGAVMLLIDPDSGEIADANPAAAAFYGYSRNTLRSMNIDQINSFTPEQIEQELALAARVGRRYFIFRHQLADGSLRTVEVHVKPFRFGDRSLLLSIIHDVTPGRLSNQGLWHYQSRLEELVSEKVAEVEALRIREERLFIIAMAAQAGVIILLVVNIRRRKRLQREHRVMARAISDERQRLIDILWGTGAGTWEWHVPTNAVRVNSQWAAMVGRAPEDVAQLTEHDLRDFIHPDDLARYLATRQQHFDGQSPAYECEMRVRAGPDGWIWVMDRGRVVARNDDGSALKMAGTWLEITGKKQYEDKLRLAASVFSHAREAIMITAMDGTIVEVNDAFCRITGFDRDDVLGRTPAVLSSGRHDADFYAAMWKALAEQGHWQGDVWNRRKNGELYAELLTISAVRDEHGNAPYYVALFSDITAQKHHESQLERYAHYDALTSLPNRLLLMDRLRQAMAVTQRRKGLLAVVYIDLDGFKLVNDTYGHAAGDVVLSTVAERFREALREGDTIARMGGDEFVALLLDPGEHGSLKAILQRLLRAATRPVAWRDEELGVSASIGVVYFPQPGPVEPDALVQWADEAMYRAKLSGKNQFYLAEQPDGDAATAEGSE
ncbi:MAG TPA: diguanylate cyclase [Denitromonas sp.]|uniref:sensor domain-containing protein n=1 Tax=Denitromonas sp. TaxID=2734609 RepID=UPI001E04945F|nr:diguanylate cyclase [Rhodocyclaceae bacterium]MCP5222928.1 diguanylate cyclase [Zoogloeaceae bacterium]HQU88093.1 diguanylate cyclase [Denitromonas sp.]HQV14263.1 diguanylate cyclase [Denitromonas sp.]